MKILVTGSSGKVGSEVVKELHKRGATVRALVHKKGKGNPTPRARGRNVARRPNSLRAPRPIGALSAKR